MSTIVYVCVCVCVCVCVYVCVCVCVCVFAKFVSKLKQTVLVSNIVISNLIGVIVSTYKMPILR